MTDQLSLFNANAKASADEPQTPALPPDLPPPANGPAGDIPSPADYAARRYLEYAMSVVTGRALPSAADGQKPVQRRILYAMHRMGLYRSPRHVKSARVVGDVIGKYHPHGDSSVYDAMVRMAQDWSLRYPIVDGQGNFGSRDGDNAAAMRYTEARLTPIAELLLAELDEGTVNWKPNYDGANDEPALLPARLPFVLLNGASGIAVGMATEIPAHNLREIAAAAVNLVRNPKFGEDDVLALIPGPDYPGGAQIISSAEEIAATYRRAAAACASAPSGRSKTSPAGNGTGHHRTATGRLDRHGDVGNRGLLQPARQGKGRQEGVHARTVEPQGRLPLGHFRERRA